MKTERATEQFAASPCYAAQGSGLKRCPRCGGSGQVADDAQIGEAMRKLRKASGLTLRALAALMGFTAPYISDLELGRRGWSSKLQDGYRKHCTKSPVRHNIGV